MKEVYSPLAWLVVVCGLQFAGGIRAQCEESDSVNFSRDVRPILAAKCFACHGPDEQQRQADLRLDLRSETIESGAIVPGEPDESELVRRVFTEDPDEQMPPRDSGAALTDAQKQLVRRWVASGAQYQRHWAFLPPVHSAVPQVEDEHWPRNEIDNFVLARLQAEGLQPSPEADRFTLVRRLYLDLIGLPPTPAEADTFVNDPDPLAYEKLVDRLLRSKHYGERWARMWLDLARYSDTNGYEKDRPRSIWPYRDWVIRALNDDMPFDQFSIEQLAGDMLPDATTDQRIATGFHRNTMLNEEGGIDPLEYRFYAMVDRVATTGTVWLGLTTGCAQCHTHKYDPIAHADYYRLMALLNNADEPDLIVPDPSVADQRRQLEEQIARLEAELPGQFPPADGGGPDEELRARNLEQKFRHWLAAEQSRAVNWRLLVPYSVSTNLPRLEVLEDGSLFSSGDITKRDVFRLAFRLDDLPRAGPMDKEQATPARMPEITALRLEVLPDQRLPAGGPGRAYYEGRKGDFFLSEVMAWAAGKLVRFESASHSYGKISIGSGNAEANNVYDGEGSTGWSTAGREGEPHQLVLVLAEPLPVSGELKLELLFERHFAASLGRFRVSVSSAGGSVQACEMPVQLEGLLAGNPQKWTAAQYEQLRRYFLSVSPDLAEVREQIDVRRKDVPSLPTTMVMQERPADNPRATYRYHRGEYLSPREAVEPGVPEVFRPLLTDPPTNRLELARWLVSPQNPLVGRVTVNRAWRCLFGAGLVRTSGDFGTQSEPPTHPELLDWLACEFVDRGWSLKSLHRRIVNSATYRQSSHATSERLQRDPQNRLLARGPRYRVDAEMVRDIMLRASGLLSAKMYGASVYPPQPASVTALAYGNTKWNSSTGEDRYRRSLYTFSKRTAPFAAYSVFDSPTGENCVARRDRSNTPLQALTLLNDEMYLEMARSLARAAFELPSASPAERASFIFRRLLTRRPSQSELTALVGFQRVQRERLSHGELDPPQVGGDQTATADSAAWVMVARAVMNLDETITKQ